MEESTSEESSVQKENPDDEIVVMPKRRKANTTSQESEDNSDKEEPKSKRTRRHKKISLTVEKGKPKSKLLRKEERDTICQELNDTDVATTLQEVVCIIKEQAVSHPYIIQLLDELIRNDSLCQELVKHHISVFIYLYNQCSTGKKCWVPFLVPIRGVLFGHHTIASKQCLLSGLLAASLKVVGSGERSAFTVLTYVP